MLWVLPQFIVSINRFHKFVEFLICSLSNLNNSIFSDPFHYDLTNINQQIEIFNLIVTFHRETTFVCVICAIRVRSEDLAVLAISKRPNNSQV